MTDQEKKARYFQDDCCANCLVPLPDEVRGLFCSEQCRQTAKTVRYWRSILRDGRGEDEDVKYALHMRVAHLLAGGYRESARRLTADVRYRVWRRDGGSCVQCGEAGAEVDHVRDDSSDLDNLQLLCVDCHRAKTGKQMVPMSDDHRAEIYALYALRVAPDVPALLCDDPQLWRNQWQGLKRARHQRLRARVGLYPDDFPNVAAVELVDWIESESDVPDPDGWIDADDISER